MAYSFKGLDVLNFPSLTPSGYNKNMSICPVYVNMSSGSVFLGSIHIHNITNSVYPFWERDSFVPELNTWAKDFAEHLKDKNEEGAKQNASLRTKLKNLLVNNGVRREEVL